MSITEQNVNGIARYLQQYLDLRFKHARRLNPHYERIGEDLEWHQLDAIRSTLSRRKPVGEIRIAVADLMVSCDHETRRGVFLPKGQLSIFNEIIPVQEDSKHKSDALAINDLLTVYSAIDASLRPIMELMRTWVWWDLPDASLMHMFESGMERINMVMGGAASELVEYYKTLDSRGAPIALNLSSKQSILDFEYYRMEEAFHTFEKRRQEEGKYQEIVAWNGEHHGVPHAAEPLVHQISQHLRARDSISRTGDVEPTLRDYYAKATHCPQEEVTPQRVLDFERVYLDKAAHDLLHVLQEDSEGERYDFKWRQLAQFREGFESARTQIIPTPISTPKELSRVDSF